MVETIESPFTHSPTSLTFQNKGRRYGPYIVVCCTYMAEDRRFELRVSAEWLSRVDAARGKVPRAAFVKRAVESALGESPARQIPASTRPPARTFVEAAKRATSGPVPDIPVGPYSRGPKRSVVPVPKKGSK